MSYELRRPYFNLSGTLTNGCTALDTSLASTVFTTLPTDYSTGSYLPLVLANDTQGKSEIVWVTGHSSAAASVTVVRGREGASAQAFSAGDVVRCSPTVRDVQSSVTTRSALPGDAHYGMRVLILDEAQVVERTSAGWDDSSPFESDPTRKHRWSQSAAVLSANNVQTATGMGGQQNGTTGSIASMTAGVVTLNKPGLWSLDISMYANSGSNRNQGPTFLWNNGAFMGSSLYQIVGVFGGSGTAGNGLTSVAWTGYVNSSQANQGISCQVYSSVAMTGCVYDVFAEYLGA